MGRNMSGLLVGAVLGLGVGLLINKVLTEDKIAEIKDNVKDNTYRAKEVIQENVEKLKGNIEKLKKDNVSTMKIEG
ncbi:MAG: YtxH domain-containing protein [Clostridium paraputrificum]